MGIGLAIGVGMLVGGLVLASMMLRNVEGQDMSPATLESFQITKNQEGSVVPLVYGKVRLTGNLLWYGNLVTEEVEQEGGKGSGGDMVVGYKYYLDIWQAICLGPCALSEVYVQDNYQSVDDLGITHFNDGTGTYYPSEPGEYACKLAGIAHIFLDRYYVGENVTNLPTFHFVVEKTLNSPVDYANLGNGINPAALIYDILLQAGASASDFDLGSFNTAAAYWKNQGYGLNITFNKQEEARALVKKVFNYVDGCLRIDENNCFVLKAFTPDDVAVATIGSDDFLEFTFSRRGWHDTWNDFRANFTDEAQDFTQRTVRALNPANIGLLGYKKQKTVDLTAFRDAPTASKRLFELMKRLSYPEAEISFKTNLSFSEVYVGDVVEINHEDYGLASARFRIVSRDTAEIDQNVINFKATQVLEGLFDTNYQTSGLSSWTTPSYAPNVFLHQKVFELPCNPLTGTDPAFIILAARENVETGFYAFISTTGTDYTLKGTYRSFSQRGVLAAQYTSATKTMDDDEGILFTPYRDDPVFSSLSRTDLFGTIRGAIIDDEIIMFQTVTPEGDTDYRLTGCIRGVFNTPVETHPAGSEIWLFNIADNIMTGISSANFFVKLLPFFGSQTVDAADVTAIQVTAEYKAKKPWQPARIKAVRSGSSISLEWWPKDAMIPGAGAVSADIQTDQHPFAFSGDFVFSGPGGTEYIAGCTKSINYPDPCTITIKARQNGYLSDAKSIFVGAADGEYIS